MIKLNETWFLQYQDQKFFTIQDALDTLKSNFKHAYFNYYDDIFGQYDWTIEPTESFEELKKIRAKQIRDSYSYIRIFASYAADSGTVLNTFLKHNIHIDEIVNYVSKWENNLTEYEQEHFTLFVPNIKNFLKKTSKTKITLKTITSKDVYEIMRATNKNYSGILPSRFDLTNISNDLNMNRLFMDLYGECKPFIMIIKGEFYTKFSFSQMHDILSRYDTIDFFTSPQFPKLHLKQCHMLKNAIKKHFPNYIEKSYKHVVTIGETGKFENGQSMENFIELCCRDFTDINLAVSKFVGNHPISFGLTDKEYFRVKGFYNSNPNLLNDYLDYVKSFYNTPMFEMENGKNKKVDLKTKIYSLGS